MSRILKYRIPVQDRPATFDWPPGAVVRAVGVQQSGEVCLWCEIPDDDSESITHVFRVVGTGHDLPEAGNYVGTVFDGPFVWHVYEVATP